MAGKALDIHQLVTPDTLGASIAMKWQEWHSLRQNWLKEKKELRNYVFATDTRTTSNSQLDWSNSTTVPKLTQLYDNLKANYTSALFPNANWMRWESEDRESNTVQKRKVIQSYLDTKMRQSDFRTTADKLVDDIVLYGNCFATVEWVEELADIADDQQVAKYIGPRMVRISPYDIVFNPTAASFENTPKIIRSIITLGELQRMIEAGGNDEYKAIFDKMLGNRREVAGSTSIEKSDGYVADGFSSIEHYYGSGYVELLTFHGDLYDSHTGELMSNRKIVIADRSYVISNEPIASWLGTSPIFHAGWRDRPDNLYAMGPLDNLVGMQYRIDHLENLRADVFDQIAVPIYKIRGMVDDFEHRPGEKILVGDEGDVTAMVPDATVLNADFQIRELENRMEEMAGAPRMAMGIRTPGEKTAFEVQTLDNAANRIFQHKAEKIESQFFMKVMNGMLESARRNMNTSDVIRVLDDVTGVSLFSTIEKEDIRGNGLIRPVGASHFAERARRIQNITNMMQMKADPTVAPHISGKMVAKIISEELGEDNLYGDNIAIKEQLETQKAAQDAEADNVDHLQEQQEQGL